MSSMASSGSGNLLVLNSNSIVRSCPSASLQPAEFARFIVLSTPLRGMELVLKPKRGHLRWSIGSGASADFTITDATLHPTHLVVERAGDEWIVVCHRDCWGFYVNDEPLETAVLDSGDRLRIGRHELIFVGGQVGEELGEDSQPASWWSRWFHRAS